MTEFDIVYTVAYRPAHFFVREVVPPDPKSPRYFGIIDKDSGKMEAFAFKEPIAKAICLALEVVHAHVTGDMRAATELMRAVERMRQ